MKKKVLFYLFLFVFASTYSQHVSREYAEKTAIAFLQKQSSQKLRSSGTLNIAMTKAEIVSGDTLLYIFEAENKNGFAVVSADFRADPILCYSPNGFLGDPQDFPPAFIDFIEAYKGYVRDIANEPTLRSSAKNPKWDEINNSISLRSTTAEIIKGPLLTTKWNQDRNYNGFCPEDPNAMIGYEGRVPTGCVATAMAQLMKYWNYPNYGIGSHSYTYSGYGTLSVDFSQGYYDWNSMPNISYTYQNEVAKLMYHCGVSIGMRYAPEGSSSGPTAVSEALVNYFKYSESIRFYDKMTYYSDSQWIEMLKLELDNDRPMLYCGTEDYGLTHALICDGYDSEDKFHFNFGWSGYYDGYYTIYNLRYYKNPDVLIGVAPKPVAVTLEKRKTAGNQVKLFGHINPDGSNVSLIRFELYEGINSTPVYVDASTLSSSSRTIDEVSSSMISLEYGKKYKYRLTAKKADNTIVYGDYFSIFPIEEDIWKKQISGVTANLNSVYMLSETTGYVCGDGGIILKTTDGGKNWIEQASGVTDDDFKGIFFIDANTGFVVSWKGKMLETTNGGTSWSIIDVNNYSIPLSGVYAESGDNVLIAAYNGIYSYNGSTVSLKSSNNTRPSTSICKANDTYFVKGGLIDNGLYYSNDNGANWRTCSKTMAESKKVTGIAAYPGSGYVLGCVNENNISENGGFLMKLDLNGYPYQDLLTSPVTTPLNGITFSSETNAYVVGNNGVILKTTNRGNDWSIISPTEINTNKLNAVSFPSLTNGWVVGDNGTILHSEAAYLLVDDEDISFELPSNISETTIIHVNTNLDDWSINYDASWLSVVKNVTEKTITVTALSTNSSSSQRSAEINVSGNGVNPVTLTAIQPKGTNTNILDITTNQTIYPNPSTGIFNITLNKDINNAIVYIYDSKGLAVYQKTVSFKSGISKEINITGASSGIYYIVIQTEDDQDVYNAKLMIK